MSARSCNYTPASKGLKLDNRPSLPVSLDGQSAPKVSANLLDGVLYTVPPLASPPKIAIQQDGMLCSPAVPLASREFRLLLAELRDRQEELFQQVLDHQHELQTQLLATHSVCKDNSDSQHEFETQLLATHAVCKANADAQASMRVLQEEWIAELCRLSSVDSSQSHQTGTAEDIAKEDTAEVEAGEEGTGTADDSISDVPRRKSTTSAAQACDQLTKSSSTVFMSKAIAGKTVVEQLGIGLRDRMNQLLSRKELELAICFAVLINAFIMCFESQYQGLDVGFRLQYPGRPEEARVVWPGAKMVFTFFDWFFGCLFLLEAIAKLICWRTHYFYKMPVKKLHGFHVKEVDIPGSHYHFNCTCTFWLRGVQGWNLLDFCSVVAFIFDRAAHAGADLINPAMLRLMRLFRIARLVRLLRFLESLDHLYIMTTAIAGLKVVLMWAIVLLTLMLLTCDLFLVQILHSTYFDKVKAEDLTEDQILKYHKMYAYFGTCSRCMLSMFEITLGNWPPVARLLSEEVSEWFTLFCLAHKLTIGFAVIGVITGVILQETFKVAQTDDLIMFRQKRLAAAILNKKMSALFDVLDDNMDSKLSMPELLAVSELPEIKTWLGALGIETDDLQTLFQLIDVDDDGVITLEELQTRMPRIRGPARSLDVLSIQHQMWKDRQGPQRGKKAVSSEQRSSFADFLLDLPERMEGPSMRSKRASRTLGKSAGA